MDDADSLATVATDLSVLDELISDVQAEAGPESPEYYDAEDAGADDDELNADDVLRQLDTVTHLSDDETNEDEGKRDDFPVDSPIMVNGTADAPNEEGEMISDDTAQTIDVEGEDGHEKAEAEDTAMLREVEQPSINSTLNSSSLENQSDAVEDESGVTTIDQLSKVEIEEAPSLEEETEEDAGRDIALLNDAMNAAEQEGNTVERDAEIPPVPDDASNSDSYPAPPPAPAHSSSAAMMTGSMNPQEDEDDDSDSDEDDEYIQPQESVISPSRPVLNSSNDDDEDELEVDPIVASTIRPASTNLDPTNGKGAKMDEFSDSMMGQITTRFENEIRVAAAVTETTFSIASKINTDDPTKSKVTHQQAGNPQNEDTFGIAYHSSKRRSKTNVADSGDTDNYTLPTGPSFPDEKEYEREVQIESGGSFSTKAANEDDEFAFSELSAAENANLNTAGFSLDELEARRARMASEKAQQEAELLQELRRATDNERKMIEIVEKQQQHSVSSNNTNDETETTLSLGELHSMYKKGLGDQSVHFLGEESGADTSAPATVPQNSKTKMSANAPTERLSVMGKILSKPRGLTDAIMEGDDEDAGDEQEDENSTESKGHDDSISAADGGRLGVQADQQTLLNYNDDDYDDEAIEGGEWKEIQLADKVTRGGTIGDADDSTASTVSPMKPQQWRISYTECAGYFAEAPEFLDQRDRIVPEEFPQRASCFSCLSRPRLTFPGAVEERDRVFCVAATPFDQGNDIFCRMLQTIYARLVPSTTSAPSLIGGHWDNIGFQGSDPSTDLRGVGVLALLQMLYLVENHGELARRLHSLSQHSTRHFPFACALINTTLQCLMALRSGELYPECNKHASIVAGMNMLFVALCAELTTEIPSSSEDVHLVLKRVLDCGHEEPLAAIDRVFDGNTLRGGFSGGSETNGGANGIGIQQATPSPASPRARPSASTNVEFTEIALHSVADD